MKKGESISMSVIIIAAIALLVLVVLAVLVLRTGGGIRDGTVCKGVGGQCMSEDQCDPNLYGQDYSKRGPLGNCKDDELCCIPVSRGAEE